MKYKYWGICTKKYSCLVLLGLALLGVVIPALAVVSLPEKAEEKGVGCGSTYGQQNQQGLKDKIIEFFI